MWLGFGINLVSGLALLLAYPAKALTNRVFYMKMALVVLGVYVAARINREISPSGVAARGAGRHLRRAALGRRLAADLGGRDRHGPAARLHAHVLFADELL